MSRILKMEQADEYHGYQNRRGEIQERKARVRVTEQSSQRPCLTVGE